VTNITKNVSLPLSNMTDAPPNSLFPPTRWTRVSALRRAPDSPEGRQALADLCQAYWYPVYAFARRKGKPVADAQDLTQGFFAKVLSGGLFESADEARGKLRSYLLTAFTRHMADEWDKTMAGKRGGGVEMLTLNFEDGEQRFLEEPACEEEQTRGFDRAWALSVVEQAAVALEAECAKQGKSELLAHLGPLHTATDEAESYDRIASRTGMSVEALRQAKRRLMLRFRELLRQAVADTLDNPDEAAVEEELRVLRSVLSS